MDNAENKTVARLSEILAISYGLPPSEAHRVRLAAALHDIGKEKINPAILNKPGKLTAEEFEVIKTHTTLGAEMLASVEGGIGELLHEVCLYHHEWHNGGGYWGKRLNDLPVACQLISVCSEFSPLAKTHFVRRTLHSVPDVFCALMSRRCYKEPWPPHEAMDYIKKQAGTQFSPELTEVFLWLVEHDERVAALFEGRKMPH